MILSVDEHEKLARAESVEEKERLLNEFTERQKLQQTVAMTAYYPARPVVKQEKHINLAYPEWADKHYHGD
ncbi:hypothetical protein [Pantoea sp.]|uniref:hypothetical protein n=1 Tax=Pantoea sp. TaxID=69393 RepID=UPI00289F6557|nr:hypothetical protein [Pantoea sp.]